MEKQLSERWFNSWLEAYSAIYRTKGSLQKRFNELMEWDKPKTIFSEESARWIEYNAKLRALNHLIINS